PELEKLLGMGREVFMNAVFVRQGEIARLIEMRPAERKKIIAELLGIETLERIWSALRLPIKLIEDRISHYSSIAKNLNETRLKLENAENELSEISSSKQRIMGELEKASEELANAEHRVEDLERMKRRHESLSNEANKIRNEVNILRERLNEADKRLKMVEEASSELSKHEEGLTAVERVENEIQNLQHELDEIRPALGREKMLRESLENTRREIRDVERELNELLGQLSRLTDTAVELDNFLEVRGRLLREADNRLYDAKEKIREIERELGAVESELSIRSENLERLRLASDKCPLCGQALTQQHLQEITDRLNREYGELKEKRRHLLTHKNRVEALLETLTQERDALLRISAENFSSLLERLEAKKRESKKIEEELKRLSDYKEKERMITDKLSKRRQELEKLRDRREKYLRLRGVLDMFGPPEKIAAERSRLAAELGEKERELRRLEQELTAIRFDETAYENALGAVRSIQEKLAKIREEAARLDEREKALNTEVLRLRRECEEAERAARKMAQLEDMLRRLAAIRQVFGRDGAQRAARSTTKASLEANARRFLQAFNMAYSDIRLDEDYNIYLYGPDGEQPIDALSGGEKIAVALSLRLAVAAALAGEKVGCLIMDEPTIHLDSEKRRELVRLLSNFRREGALLPQAIVVTHDREVEEAADQLYELTRVGGFSKLEKNLPTPPTLS
ncbi:MAG: AAA family ATPase, partial [Aigarchaeota archaeon]|nr:AAA family ATPase [Candidatus Pelearchaeum maunauluense]